MHQVAARTAVLCKMGLCLVLLHVSWCFSCLHRGATGKSVERELLLCAWPHRYCRYQSWGKGLWEKPRFLGDFTDFRQPVNFCVASWGKKELYILQPCRKKCSSPSSLAETFLRLQFTHTNILLPGHMAEPVLWDMQWLVAVRLLQKDIVKV